MGLILVPVISVTVIGIICATILSVASKVMAVKVDERVEQIQDCLPGSNCGACGFPGCSGYAAALSSQQTVKTNLCAPGGAAVAKRLSAILGVDAGEVEKKIAIVRCRGDKESAKEKMEYKGIQSCFAEKQVYGGSGACAFGCLGHGDCALVCPAGAVCVEDGLARIDPRLCTGCGRCVKACPNKLITVEKSSVKTVVFCSNIEKGASARQKCQNCCIACGKCTRECPVAAISIVDNLAVIDYEKCTDCGHCAGICIMHCIREIS